jgi:hypothetical protein
LGKVLVNLLPIQVTKSYLYAIDDDDRIMKPIKRNTCMLPGYASTKLILEIRQHGPFIFIGERWWNYDGYSRLHDTLRRYRSS